MIGIAGAGAFGTALAVVQAQAGRDVVLWGRAPDKMAEMRTRRRSDALPGLVLPEPITLTADITDLANVSALLCVVPAQQTEAFLTAHGTALPACPLVLCAKGIEPATGRTQIQIARDAGQRDLAVLTGPGFAGEIARSLPTALTLACTNPATGAELQRALASSRLRLYLTSDVTGAQLGGALKNVVALACGMCAGAELGASAGAALMTRGFAEISRLAMAMGAEPATLAGLSGLGDLALTCGSAKSRNFAAGFAIGSGQSAPGGTIEGIATARAACTLAELHGVEMPIASSVANVLDGTQTLHTAMAALLARPLKEE